MNRLGPGESACSSTPNRRHNLQQQTTGVLVIKPDRAVFEDLRAKSEAKALPSYDGGDTGACRRKRIGHGMPPAHQPCVTQTYTLNHTGFLNACFHDWFQGPPAGRLPFAYNAQRTLYWMTHEKTPGYWEAVQPIRVRDSPWLACTYLTSYLSVRGIM